MSEYTDKLEDEIATSYEDNAVLRKRIDELEKAARRFVTWWESIFDKSTHQYLRIMELRAVLGEDDAYRDRETISGGEIEDEPCPEIWVCQSCGKEFNEKRFSHDRAVDDGKGNPVPVECGPISKV